MRQILIVICQSTWDDTNNSRNTHSNLFQKKDSESMSK